MLVAGGKSPIPSSLQGINVSALQFPQFTAALDNFCHLQHQEFCHNNTGFQKVLTFLTDAASVVWRIAFFLLPSSLRVFQVCVKQTCFQVVLARTHQDLHVGEVVQGPFAVVMVKVKLT